MNWCRTVDGGVHPKSPISPALLMALRLGALVFTDRRHSHTLKVWRVMLGPSLTFVIFGLCRPQRKDCSYIVAQPREWGDLLRTWSSSLLGSLFFFFFFLSFLHHPSAIYIVVVERERKKERKKNVPSWMLTWLRFTHGSYYWRGNFFVPLHLFSPVRM